MKENVLSDGKVKQGGTFQTSVLHCQDSPDSIPSSWFPQFQQPGSPKTHMHTTQTFTKLNYLHGELL